MLKHCIFDSCLRLLHKRYKPIFRMKSGVPAFQAGDGRSSPTPGMQEGIIDAYGPGQYTYILTYLYADGHTAESKGNLIVYAQTPATLVDTTPPYLTQFHSNNQISQTNQATLTPTIQQEVDRWGNVLATNDTRMSWASGLWRTTYEYNAHNQIIGQSRAQDTQAINTTRIYYDQLSHLPQTELGQAITNPSSCRSCSRVLRLKVSCESSRFSVSA